MLVQLSVVFEGSNSRLGHSSRRIWRLGRIDQIDSDTESRLRRVHLHLSMLLVLLPLRLDLVNGLLQEDLQLSL